MKTFLNFPIIEKKRIELKAKVPQKISIPGGTNILNSLFEFNHNPIHNYKTVEAKFTRNANNSALQVTVYLDDEFNPVKELGRKFFEDGDISPVFYCLEFSCEEEISFDFSIYRDFDRLCKELIGEAQKSEARYIICEKKLSQVHGVSQKKDLDDFFISKRIWQTAMNNYFGFLSYLKLSYLPSIS